MRVRTAHSRVKTSQSCSRSRRCGSTRWGHPTLDVATVHCGFLYGHTGRGQVLDTPADGTNALIHQPIHGPAGRHLPAQNTSPASTHVREAGRVHVLALKAPADPERQKRVVVVGPESSFTWVQAVRWLHEVRPELRVRFPRVGSDEQQTPRSASNAREVVGFEKSRDWKETVGNAVDGILEKERKLGF